MCAPARRRRVSHSRRARRGGRGTHHERHVLGRERLLKVRDRVAERDEPLAAAKDVPLEHVVAAEEVGRGAHSADLRHVGEERAVGEQVDPAAAHEAAREGAQSAPPLPARVCETGTHWWSESIGMPPCMTPVESPGMSNSARGERDESASRSGSASASGIGRGRRTVQPSLLGRHRLLGPARCRRRTAGEHLVAAEQVPVPLEALAPRRVHGAHHGARDEHAGAAERHAAELRELLLRGGNGRESDSEEGRRGEAGEGREGGTHLGFSRSADEVLLVRVVLGEHAASGARVDPERVAARG